MGESAFAKWTAIVLTCRNEQVASAFQKGANANVCCISHLW